MGTVIRFPDEKRLSCNGEARPQGAPASIVILPVIRVERQVEGPADGLTPDAGTPRGPGRRRPGRRS
jgi:hypothetical protein